MPFLSSSGISVLNIIRGGAAGEVVPLLLDLYPATAAYSLRKLRVTYTGDAIGVRIDTTGQPTYDIGFNSNGNLDTADLLSKAAGNDAYVTTWYDQSGNGNNATNLAAASQPRIVNAGSLETNNGVAAIYFDGSADSLIFDNINTYAAFIVENVTIVGGFGLLGSTANSNIIGDLNYFNGRIRLNNANYDFAVSNTDNALTVLNRSSNDYSYFVNSNASTNNPRTIAFDMNLNAMMNRQGIFFYEGYLNEIIIYNSDQSANISSIENNINAYYQIYWDGSQTGLLDDYPGASAAYSVTALNSAYTGPLIKVRRSSDNAELDIYAKYNGDLDTNTLLAFVGTGGTNNGFITIWYDQSGNANNLTQSAAAEQPQIVSSGSLITDGDGIIAPLYDGINDDMNVTSLPFTFSTDSVSLFMVAKALGNDQNAFNLASTNDYFAATYGRSTPGQLVVNYYEDSGLVNESIEGTAGVDKHLLSTIFTRGTTSLAGWINGSAMTNPATGLIRANFNTNVIGSRGGSYELNGTIQLMVIYDSDQTANRSGIETIINNYYSIYP